MWFVRDEDGKTHCVEEVEKAAEDFARSVKHCYEIQKNINERLRKENQKLKDEHYKDEELQMWKQKYENVQKELYNGFGITDEEMEMLADYVEFDVRNEFPDVADKMFRLWRKSINGEEYTQDERTFLNTECDKANAYWWSAIEDYAVNELGAPYYEDIL